MFNKNEKHLLEMVAWTKIMGKFEVGYWMGAKKEEDGMREREQKDFGPVSAFYTTTPVVKS